MSPDIQETEKKTHAQKVSNIMPHNKHFISLKVIFP